MCLCDLQLTELKSENAKLKKMKYRNENNNDTETINMTIHLIC